MILLDTHVWVWLANGSPRLPQTYVRALDRMDEPLALSVMSVWEISMLVRKGRVNLSVPLPQWIDGTSAELNLAFVPITREIALEADSLPGVFHQDPADRMIVATARVHQAKLATFDGLILGYPQVELFRP